MGSKAKLKVKSYPELLSETIRLKNMSTSLMKSKSREMPAWVVADLLDRIDMLEGVILESVGQLPPKEAIIVSQIYMKEAGETTTELFKRKNPDSSSLGVDDNADM